MSRLADYLARGETLHAVLNFHEGQGDHGLRQHGELVNHQVTEHAARNVETVRRTHVIAHARHVPVRLAHESHSPLLWVDHDHHHRAQLTPESHEVALRRGRQPPSVQCVVARLNHFRVHILPLNFLLTVFRLSRHVHYFGTTVLHLHVLLRTPRLPVGSTRSQKLTPFLARLFLPDGDLDCSAGLDSLQRAHWLAGVQGELRASGGGRRGSSGRRLSKLGRHGQSAGLCKANVLVEEIDWGCRFNSGWSDSLVSDRVQAHPNFIRFLGPRLVDQFLGQLVRRHYQIFSGASLSF